MQKKHAKKCTWTLTLYHIPYTTYKNELKMLKKAMLRLQTIKIPRKKWESPNIGFGNNFLDMTQKAHVTTTTTTTKIEKWKDKT